MTEPTPSTSSGRGSNQFGAQSAAMNETMTAQLSLLLEKMTIQVAKLREAVHLIDFAIDATSTEERREILSDMRILGRGSLFEVIPNNIEDLLWQYLAVLSQSEALTSGEAFPITTDEIMSLDETCDPNLLSVKRIWTAVEGFRAEARDFAAGFQDDLGDGQDEDTS